MSKAAAFCLVANVAGLGGYLYFCSRLWADMPEGVIYADDGPSAISWFLEAFPFEVLCALTNVVVLVMAVRRLFAGRDWRLLATWAAMVGSWGLMHLYVRSHIIG
jgi:hypothetical protein